MKKILIPVIILFVLAGAACWAGATFFFGSATGAWLTTEMEKLQQQSGASGVIDFDESEYKKGFFSSEATTTLRIVNVPVKEFDGITLKHRIYHGPLAKTPDGIKVASNYLITTIDVESLPEEAREVITAGFGGKNPFTLKVTGGFGGATEAEVEIPPFNYQGKDGKAAGRMEFAGITGRLRGTGSGGDGQIEIGALKFEDEGKNFVLDMAPGTITADVRAMAEEIPIDADVEYLFPKLSVTAEGQSFRVNDIAANYGVTSKDSETLGGTYEFTISSVKLPASPKFNSFRGAVENGVRMNFDVEGMEIAAVKELLEAQRAMQEAQADTLSKGTSEMTPENIRKTQETAEAFTKSVLAMIQEGFGMGIGIDLGADSDKSELTLKLKYIATGKSTDLKTMGDLISAFSGDLKLRLNKSLIPPKQAERLAMPAAAMGFIVGKDSHVESVMKLSGAVLEINGKPMPLLEQMGPQAQQPIPWEQIFQGAAMSLQQ